MNAKRWVVVKRPLIDATGFGESRPRYRHGDIWADPQIVAAETATDAIRLVAEAGGEYAAFELPGSLTPIRAVLGLERQA